jgi:Rieske Fe-S protein
MACKDCLNRREFLTRSALVAAAIVVADGCGDGQIGPPGITGVTGDPLLPLGGPITVNLANFPGLETPGTIVDVGSERAVIRTGPSTFTGLSRICSHQHCEIDIRVDHFECPCHGSQFAADGSVIRGPNVQSPPIGPLRMLAVTYDQAANTLTVE